MSICRFRFALLAILLSISITLASPIAHAPRYTSPNGPQQRRHGRYHPINPSIISDYEGRQMTDGAGVGDWVQHGVGGLMHMVNREYGLRESESFYWGPAGNPQANLTAFAGGKAVRVLSMERFQNVLDNAKCTANSVQFTFVKNVQFDSVQKEWGWINDADDNYLVLVTENKACNIPDGDPTVRQPWHVTKAVFDDKTRVVTLMATPKTWKDAFPSWHLKVSSKGIVPPGSRSMRRGLERRHTYNHTGSISLAHNLNSDPVTIFGDSVSGLSGSIACNPCHTTGALDYEIDITYSMMDITTAKVTITPDNVGAMFTAVLDVSAELTSPQRKVFNLLTYNPTGISIPYFIDIGPTLYIDLMAEISSVSAKVSALSAGVEMQIPENAIAVLDYVDPSRNTFQNWVPTFKALAPQTPSAEISLSADAGLEWRIELEIELFGEALGAGLALDAPTIGFDLTAEAADGGVCGAADADFGIDFDINLGAQLNAFAGFGSAAALPNLQPLLSTTMDLYSTCLVLASGAPAGPTTSSGFIVPKNSSVAAAPSASTSSTAAVPAYVTSSVAPTTSQAWPTHASSRSAHSSLQAPATSSASPASGPSIAPPVSYGAVPASSSPSASACPSFVVVYVSVVDAVPSTLSSW